MKALPSLVFFVLLITATGFAQQMRKEVDVGFTTIDKIRPVMQKALSPTGKFLYFERKGTVLVMDDIANIAVAEQALSQLDVPQPEIFLQTAFKTGLTSTAVAGVGQTRRSSISIGREIPFPVEFDPPRIPNSVGGNAAGVIVTPATPTRFETRFIGTRSDVGATINPNGSITLDINTENTSFEGFINFGSPIMVTSGGLGTVGVNGQVTNPTFFQSVIPNNILLPIIGTTRVSTSVVVWPRASRGNVQVDLMPRLTIETEEQGAEEVDIDLKQFRTTMTVPNNGVGRVYGFTNASEDFNRNFLGAKNLTYGGTSIIVKAQLKRPSAKTEQVGPEQTKEDDVHASNSVQF